MHNIASTLSYKLATSAVFIPLAPLAILNHAADIPYACLSELLLYGLFGLSL
jgi:hypothetical protein